MNAFEDTLLGGGTMASLLGLHWSDRHINKELNPGGPVTASGSQGTVDAVALGWGLP